MIGHMSPEPENDSATGSGPRRWSSSWRPVLRGESRSLFAFLASRTIPQGEIARGAIGTFFLRGLNYFFLVFFSLVLARLLGPRGYGAYAFAMTSLEILGPVALLGLDPLVMREVAVYQAKSQWGLLRGLLRRADQLAMAAALAVIALVLGVSLLFESQFDPLVSQALWVVLAALPFLVAVRLRQAAMIGLRRVVLAQVGEALLQPLVVCMLFGAILVLLGRGAPVPYFVFANVVAVAVAYLTCTVLLKRVMPHEARTAEPAYRTKKWGRGALMFWLTINFIMLNSGIGVIFLGIMETPESAGIFAAARVLATIVATPLIFIGLPLAPALARSFATQGSEHLQEAATKAARLAFLFATPVVLLYLIFGDWILSLYGEDFVLGYHVLVILALGQLANVGFGFVENLLQMTGHERPVAAILGFTALLNACLCVLLIPLWGIEGAAVASAAAMIIWNVALAAIVGRVLRIRPTVLG